MNDTVIAVDLGGTNLRLAVVDLEGSILYRSKRSTRGAAGSQLVIDDISEAANECIAAVPEAKIGAMGIAVPATVDFAAGIAKNSPNLPVLNGLDVPRIISERLGLRTVLDNDATAAAIGEHWLGATRDAENSVCVTLGTGVGGGLILNGKPYRGVDGTAGEIGHIAVERDGHPCGCGSHGCVEQYASATAIVRIAGELRSKHPDSFWAAKEDLSAADLYEAGSASDDLALEVFSIMGSYLGMALADLVNILNPETIVIGGGVAGAWDLFISATANEIARRSFPEPAERVKLKRAKLGDDAGILGAARLALSTLT